MSDQSFKEFVLDQLDALPEVRAKAMFGGYAGFLLVAAETTRRFAQGVRVDSVDSTDSVI